MKNIKVAYKVPLLITLASLACCVVVGTMATRISKETVVTSIENKLIEKTLRKIRSPKVKF